MTIDSLTRCFGSLFTNPDSVQRGSVANKELPDDVIFQIFSYLRGLSLSKASVVCRDWQKVANDERLWKLIFYL